MAWKRRAGRIAYFATSLISNIIRVISPAFAGVQHHYDDQNKWPDDGQTTVIWDAPKPAAAASTSQSSASRSGKRLVVAEATSPTGTAAAASHTQVTQALNRFTLTPIQRLSVRNYVGESKVAIEEFRTETGEFLLLRDPSTHAYVGEVSIHAGDDGTIVVSKLTGAEFDRKATVEIPVMNRETEEAEKTLSGSESFNSFKKAADSFKAPKEGESGGKEISVSAISAEGKIDYGSVAEATAVFKPDGSGYERGFRTKLGSADAGVEVGVSGKADGDGFAGAKAGVGGRVFPVEVFGNYFRKPDVDAEGNFTRAVLGASAELHGTLLEAEAKAGCFEGKGCGASFALGGLGIGSAFGLTYGESVKMDVKPEAEIGEHGLSSESGKTEANAAADEDLVPDDEQKAFETAVKSNDISELEAFLSAYPDNPYADTVGELEAQAKSGKPGTPPPAGGEESVLGPEPALY